MMPEASDAILANRYRWFCAVGVYRPTLNHPSIIYETATADKVDQIITSAMNEWSKSRLNKLKK